MHSYWPHLDDACAIVVCRRDDARLRSGERDGFASLVPDSHGEQRHGNALPCGEDHVQLATMLGIAYFTNQRQKGVCGSTHGRDHYDGLMSLSLFVDDPLSDRLEPIRSSD